MLRPPDDRIAHLSPEAVAADEDFWADIQQSFSVTRGIVNLNNGGVSPSPRMVTEAFVRYTWQQEDATAYTMWQMLEPQSETIRTGLAEIFGCSAEEIAITRNASESLEILLMGLDLKSGDEIVTTTQDYPRMLTTLRQREMREGLKLNLIKSPDRAKGCKRPRHAVRTGDHAENQTDPRLAPDKPDRPDHARPKRFARWPAHAASRRSLTARIHSPSSISSATICSAITSALPCTNGSTRRKARGCFTSERKRSRRSGR